ncbi:four helix bundle protein [bacterium]|nr:four helix bundle protein [bacterium]
MVVGNRLETQHWTGTALDCGYLDAQTANELNLRCERIDRMLGGMMGKAEEFCGTL